MTQSEIAAREIIEYIRDNFYAGISRQRLDGILAGMIERAIEESRGQPDGKES